MYACATLHGRTETSPFEFKRFELLHPHEQKESIKKDVTQAYIDIKHAVKLIVGVSRYNITRRRIFFLPMKEKDIFERILEGCLLAG